jgi:hypothetical protein
MIIVTAGDGETEGLIEACVYDGMKLEFEFEYEIETIHHTTQLF